MTANSLLGIPKTRPPPKICQSSARHPEIKILPVELSTARIPIGIFTLKNRSLNPVAQLFIEHAREVAKSLAKQK